MVREVLQYCVYMPSKYITLYGCIKGLDNKRVSRVQRALDNAFIVLAFNSMPSVEWSYGF